MRLNQFLAKTTDLSRRSADQAIADGRVLVNEQLAKVGQSVEESDSVRLDGKLLSSSIETKTIQLNKPYGYVVSKDGQGSKTIYELLPDELQNLKPIGRLDRNSTGLLLLTNDGHLNQTLSHPSHQKDKVYKVLLHKELSPEDKIKI